MKKTNKKRMLEVPQLRRSARFNIDMRAPFVICIIEAALLFSLCIGVLVLGNADMQIMRWLLVSVTVFYILSAGLIFIVLARKYRIIRRAEEEADRLNTEILQIFRHAVDYPFAVIDENGKVRILNGALQDILGYRSIVTGIDFAEFCDVALNIITSRAENRNLFEYHNSDLPEEGNIPERPVTMLSNGRRYRVYSYVMRHQSENYFLVAFEDIEDYLALVKRSDDESPVIAYITFDNLRELTRYVRADYRSVSTQVAKELQDWIESLGGIIREYDRDRYLAIFSKKSLDEQISNSFEIQQKIMALQIGDNSFPITISMGIASVSGNIHERASAAHDALNVAIARGGNQVAIKRDSSNDYIFIGGTHKTIENNTSVTSRVGGDILEQKISEASNVLIMGHADPDFDSIGSCIGMARFSMAVLEAYGRSDVPINIVVDKNCETYEICADQLKGLSEYDKVFISKEGALDRMQEDSVLVICDVNNMYIYESPDLARSANHIAVIDHHRLAAPLSFTPFLQYVETTKSSASEIVSEIIQQSKFSSCLHKEEAALLLAGIMLDTKNFTRNSGAQTFAITNYLYSRGAHTNVSREFFNEDIDEVLSTCNFESKAQMYGEGIIISAIEGRRTLAEDKILASKVADRLLTVKGVEASFALILVGNDVIVSARSKGKLNVQLILERIRGGGHFDAAGASLKNTSLETACVLLKNAIDDYFISA